MAKGASAAISEVSSTRNSEKGSSTDRRSRKTLPYGSTTGIATSSAIAIRRENRPASGRREHPGGGRASPDRPNRLRRDHQVLGSAERIRAGKARRPTCAPSPAP